MNFLILGRSGGGIEKKNLKKNHKNSSNRRPLYIVTTLKVNFQIIGLTKGIQFAVKIVPFFLYAVTMIIFQIIWFGRTTLKGKKKRMALTVHVYQAFFVHFFAITARPHRFFYKNVVFPAQAEYSYFSADFRLKIFLYYS